MVQLTFLHVLVLEQSNIFWFGRHGISWCLRFAFLWLAGASSLHVIGELNQNVTKILVGLAFLGPLLLANKKKMDLTHILPKHFMAASWSAPALATFQLAWSCCSASWTLSKLAWLFSLSMSPFTKSFWMLSWCLLLHSIAAHMETLSRGKICPLTLKLV